MKFFCKLREEKNAKAQKKKNARRIKYQTNEKKTRLD